ncbi:hypothetical protein H072_1389 [Dactylellina haptotyla CBS 200.50]|uniref:RING-type E3 ubiquitin transferase n=1 Tax=Dactylellina haptotyla (strain CBS 200.50) TaxID=1284197 RepID=S8ANW3_DACHA|nr:hypothetical protein H072_1389 [Dactylellina haptotyla CBS 200.50]
MAATASPAPNITQERPPEFTKDVESISSSTSDTLQTPESCCICLGTISSATRAVATPCLHACFDFSCLVTWLEGAQSVCPVCKQAIENVKYNFDPTGTGFQKYRIKCTAPVTSSNARSTRTLHRRSETRRHTSSRYSSNPNDKPDDIARRQFVYKHRLRSLHMGVNRKSRFANYTPRSVRQDPELLSKAKAFIRRELEVFDWTEANREWLVEYIIAIVKTVNLKGAEGKAEDLLEEFLGREFAGVFIHELNAFLKSPFVRVRDFDGWAQYEMDIPADVGEVDLGER